jgi:hypothetical protein
VRREKEAEKKKERGMGERGRGAVWAVAQQQQHKE